MSIQFTLFHAPDNWSTTPPHPGVSASEHKLLRYVYFDPGVFLFEKQRRSASNGILWLPLGSIVAAFACGHKTHPPDETLVPYVYIYKSWHQDPNYHCTMRLGWQDAQGNTVKTFGKAHVHQNGLETICEWKTGGLLVRPYGQAEYDWHPPAVFAQAIPMRQAARASVAPDWTTSDDEADQEGYGMRVIARG
ncbi:hypothetical protein SLS60_000991 [Paraconiothyrium brasiliense]|uniref:Uncharacterized protein n=1 Tax=Paraconiothyrium brasiliense TaxID=300254 RepID=A0ABR3S998_9PLEO